MTLTVLRSQFGPLAKIWQSDGTILGYSSGQHYTLDVRTPQSLDELAVHLSLLEYDSHACVIRGTRNAVEVASILPERNRARQAQGKPPTVVAPGQILRVAELFDDAPIPWVMIDVDKYAGGDIEQFIQAHLPAAFHDASYYWQFGGSSGHPSRAGLLSAHLWFWLDTPRTGTELAGQRWPNVDPSMFRRVQPHYTARPLGETVPPGPRSGLVKHSRGDVALRLMPLPPQAPRTFKPLPADLDVAKVTADLRAALALIPADDRDTWIRVGHYLHNLGELGFELWEEWSRTSDAFDEEGLDRWDAFTPSTVDHRAVFVAAREYGWGTGTARVDPSTVFGSAPMPLPPTAAPVLAVQPNAISVTEMPGTESALAQSFAVAAHGNLVWSPGHGWLLRAGPVWEPDELERRHLLMREVCRAAGQGQAAATLKALGKYGTARSALKEAETYPTLQVPRKEWDATPYELNTPQGVVDLRTGNSRMHDAGDRFLKVTATHPIDGPRPLWDAFLDFAFAGDQPTIEFLQRSMGCWLTGIPSSVVKSFWYLVGPGDTGKSIITDTAYAMLGSYARVLSPDAILMPRGGQRHPADIAMLEGYRLSITSELPDGEPLNQPLMKSLTGDEQVSARTMGKDPRDIAMRQSMVMSGNHKLRLPGGDKALGRRLLLVQMRHQVPLELQDPNLLRKLQSEWPAIMAWAVEGARKWLADGAGRQALCVPPHIQLASDDYIAEENDVAVWVDECCERHVLYSTKSIDAYNSFRAWKALRGEPAAAYKTWLNRAVTVPGVAFAKRSVSVMLGVRLGAA